MKHFQYYRLFKTFFQQRKAIDAPKFVVDFRKKMLLFLLFFKSLEISILTFFGATFSDCHTLFGATFARNMGKFFDCGFMYNGTSAFAKNYDSGYTFYEYSKYFTTH